MTAPEVRALYRAFLRELPRRSYRSPLQTRIRSALTTSSPSSSLAAAQEYLTYLRSQRIYATLLERYNPALSGEMDEEERVRLSARRVGMNLPEVVERES
ncbi:MAG: hypothetical protein M1832_001134 [Thelocarpon impressellum]|nr:MAG: hypothetical protein M1832_001134 [Thelocarpon impressellum]